MQSNNLIQNYFLAAYRSLTKDKVNLVLTILGLSFGLCASLLVIIYAINESSYDKFQPNSETTYRVVQHHVPSSSDYPLTTPRADQHIRKIPGVEDVFTLIRTQWIFNSKVKIGDMFFNLDHLQGAPENINDFVKIETIDGDLVKVLAEPDYIALSESEANRLYGTTDAVGKTMLFVKYDVTLTVGAVFKDLPDNTHFAIESMLSSKPYMRARGNHSFTYIRMSENADKDLIEKELTRIYAELWSWDPKELTFYLQPMLDIHLDDNLMNDMKFGGSKQSLNIAIVLSLLLLLISSFNYINMSVAQAGMRAKEVGVRKVLGASRRQIITQFLSESVAIVIIATLIASCLVELLLPEFSNLVSRDLTIDDWLVYAVCVVLGAVLVGVASGLYPALFISSYNTRQVLSGDLQRGKTAVTVRKILMIFQSGFSIALIIGAITLYSQVNFLKDLPVNYEKENRLRITDAPEQLIYSPESAALFNDMMQIEGVISATPADFELTKSTYAGISNVLISGVDSFTNEVAYGGVGFDAVKTLGLTLITGRDFTRDHASDWFNPETNSASILIPESLLTAAGYENPEQALGKVWQFNAGRVNDLQGRVVGVFKDVKIGSSKERSLPVVFAAGLPASGVNSVVINVVDSRDPLLLQRLTQFIKTRLDVNPVNIEVVSDKYEMIYREENNLTRLVTIFSMLAVFLTCVGMFGLTAFNTQRRSREVAIRKVLGASRMSLVKLLTKEALVLSLVSVILSFPCAFWAVDSWLSHYNDRISQSPWIYLFSLVTVLTITWMTISYIAFKTASSRPSNVLRAE